jgi:alkylhydroperoxidase domain protein
VPDKIVELPPHTAPDVFTRVLLDWLPWLEPLAEEGLTERQMAGLVDAVRAKSPYFRLLARDSDALRARTLTDKDIFYNPEAGLPRGERELAAAATSRFNGGIYCASVHARHSATYSKRPDDVQRLLDEGVTVDLGESWNAIIAACVALSATPIAFGGIACQASSRSRRSGDRRCHPGGGILQLGEPADVVARRTRTAGRGISTLAQQSPSLL